MARRPAPIFLPAAGLDIDDILEWSEAEFGATGAARYARRHRDAITAAAWSAKQGEFIVPIRVEATSWKKYLVTIKKTPAMWSPQPQKNKCHPERR